MMFVLQADDGGLWAMPDEKRVLAYFESPDVEAGEYSFFADDGAPLTPIFEPPRTFLGIAVESSKYVLVKSKAGPNLLERAGEIKFLENETFASVADVLEYLHSKRPA